MTAAAAAGHGDERPRTMLDPEDLQNFGSLARPLDHWEREMLATLFTVERQGLTLVYFLTQLEPFLILRTAHKRLNNPSATAIIPP
jgi:hypothetical protein